MSRHPRALEQDRFPVGHRGEPPAVRRVRLIACGCGRGDWITDNTTRVLPTDVVAGKFREKGWRIGRALGKDECPRCVAKSRQKPQKDEPMTKPATPPLTVVPSPEPPRQPTIPERRKIMEELEIVYLVSQQRYSGSTTDKSLAERLNVPRAWVTELRESLFGPEANEAQAQRNQQLDEVEVKLNELEASAYSELDRITGMIAALKKQLDALR